MINQYCALPDCGKLFNNCRSRFCCRSHGNIYAAKSRHGTLGLPNKSKEYLEEYNILYREFRKTFVGPMEPKAPRIYNISSVKNPKKEYISIETRKANWSAYIVNRRKKRDKSMPAWADKDAILEFYKEARRLTEETGILHEVDHIIPSNHKLVCGLHNEFNLQVLPKVENQIKSNKFVIE